MKIVTWNINSVRARLLAVVEWLAQERPDVVLLQETKCTKEQFPYLEFEDLGYNVAVHGQKGFNGVAILARSSLEDVMLGLPTLPEDDQARYIEAVVQGNIRVASVYIPNGQAIGSGKFDYKIKFLDAFRSHLENLLLYEERCVVGGDYNIAPEDRDVHNPVQWAEQVLCSTAERRRFRAFLNLGYIDAVRVYHTQEGPFSWWDYRTRAFEQGEGLRIDHLLLSAQAADRLQNAGIDSGLRAKEKASDHAPVWCELKELSHELFS